MGDMVIGFSVVRAALNKVQSMIEDEAKLLQSVKRDIVFITGEIQIMHSFLNAADKELVQKVAVRTWVRRHVCQLSCDVEGIDFVDAQQQPVSRDYSAGPIAFLVVLIL
jgi:hypothetical protein